MLSKKKWGVVGHAFNPSYLGAQERIPVQGQPKPKHETLTKKDELKAKGLEVWLKL
jgi:hypothetical protein